MWLDCISMLSGACMREDEHYIIKKGSLSISRAKTGQILFVDNEVLHNIEGLHSEVCAVADKLIQNCTLATAGNRSIPAHDFKASSGWTMNFMSQNGPS